MTLWSRIKLFFGDTWTVSVYMPNGDNIKNIGIFRRPFDIKFLISGKVKDFYIKDIMLKHEVEQ